MAAPGSERSETLGVGVAGRGVDGGNGEGERAEGNGGFHVVWRRIVLMWGAENTSPNLIAVGDVGPG
jgi:hypothetical protein